MKCGEREEGRVWSADEAVSRKRRGTPVFTGKCIQREPQNSAEAPLDSAERNFQLTNPLVHE